MKGTADDGRVRRSRARFLLAGLPIAVIPAAFALILLLAGVGAAGAHAALTASEPADGSLSARAPASYSLTFSEPVSPLVLKLVEPDGTAVPLDRFEQRGNTLAIEAPPGLGPGTHVLRWRVVSGDGHPIGGALAFSIGAASPASPIVEDDVDWTVRGGLWLSRIALYIGLFAGVGGVFARRVLMQGITAGGNVAAAALALGVAGAIVSAGFQGLDALGAPAGRLSDALVWSAGLGTTHGATVGAALAAFALAAAGLMLKGRGAGIAAVAALLAASLAPALSGHASAAPPQWLMRPAVFLHVATAVVWIGALAPLGLAVRRGEAGATAALLCFSRVIPVFVAVLILAGMALAAVQVGDPKALLDTAYGHVFLVKLAALVALFVLAGVNRWTLTAPSLAGDQETRRRLTRSIGAETLLALAILAAVAAWRFTPPPRVLAAEAAQPATVELQSAHASVLLWIGPGRAGPVDVVANVLGADFGPLEPDSVSVTFLDPEADGVPPAHALARGTGMADWRAGRLVIPRPGIWRVRVDLRIGDSGTDSLHGEVRIRP